MATVPSQQTVAVNQPITASLWNDDVRDAVNFLINPPRCAAYASSTTSLSSGTTKVIALDGESFDSDGMHSTSSNNSRVIAKTAGTYLVVAQLTHTAASSGGRQMSIRLNAGGNPASGSEVWDGTHDSSPSASGQSILRAGGLVQLALNDYLEMFGYQSSGSSNTTASGANKTFLHMFWIGT